VILFRCGKIAKRLQNTESNSQLSKGPLESKVEKHFVGQASTQTKTN